MRKFILLILATANTICMGTKEFLPGDIALNESITTPNEYFGFSVGKHHMLHHQVVGYMQLLAGQSNRMQWIEYGRTHGNRPLGQLIISSPENLARIGEIRASHLKLADPADSKALQTGDMPVVVNMNYSVHGNETSGANAAPVVAYYLAAAEGQEIGNWLDKMVVLLDPVLNPDGLDRFSNWTNDNAGKNPNPDPNTREHTEGWPNGRTNYYWFDLNRDWMLLTQPESRGRIQQYHKWLPNFVLDFHEMGTDATYFFQPGVPERTHPLIPANVIELTRAVSMYFADALDKKNSLYFTRERYDDFYMGKGSTIADLKGAIGILFEQASARGIIQDSVNGPLSFEYAISNQVSVSLAVLKGAYEMREEFLNHMHEFFKDSIREAEKESFAGYRFASKGDPARAMCLVEVLQQHDIDVFPIADEEAWFVPLTQPNYKYLEALVEQRKEFEESVFYDITAWTLPLAYNLEWSKLRKAPATGSLKSNTGQLEKSTMGYLFSWAHLNSPKILFDLFQAGIKVKIARQPFRLNGMDFGYGTVFVPLRQQTGKSETVHSILGEAMRNNQLPVVPVSTYLTESGIDLGSSSFATIEEPRILLAAARGVDTYAAGSIWHLFDVYQDYPLTLIEPYQLQDIGLDNYTALILPGGGSSVYPESLIPRLRDWVKNGGVLVCMGSTPKWAIEHKLSSGSLVKAEKQTPPEQRPFASASDDKALQDIKGAVFDTRVDITHPIAYGYTRGNLPVFLDRKDFLSPSANPYNTPLLYTENPLLAGYASGENLEQLAGSAAVVVEPSGSGSIILFTHSPTFRGYWRGTEKLLLNAVLFGRLMDPED